jgi:4a-hydroxytetrahydrobiopterin dehydratase
MDGAAVAMAESPLAAHCAEIAAISSGPKFANFTPQAPERGDVGHAGDSIAAVLGKLATGRTGDSAMEVPEGWALSEDGKALERSFRFKDFSEAFAFLTRVAMHAEKVDHHPEFTNVWNRVDFRLTTHDTGGVTERDVKLAEAINRLA